MSEGLWIALIGTMGGLLGGALFRVVDARLSKRVSDSQVASNYAEAAESTAGAYASILGRLTVLEATVSAQQRTIRKLRGWASDVVAAFNANTAQLRELGQEPRAPLPTPPVDEDNNGS